MGRKVQQLQVKWFPQTRAKPPKSTSPIVTRQAGSRHSRICGCSAAATTTTAPCSVVQQFGLIVSISPWFSKVVTTKVAPSSPLHSAIPRVSVSMVSSPATRSSNAVAPSISISGVGLSPPLSLGSPSGCTRISDVESSLGVFRPMLGSRTLVLLSSRPSYHRTVIPALHASH